MGRALLWGRGTQWMLAIVAVAASGVCGAWLVVSSAQAAGSGQESAGVRSELSHFAPQSGSEISDAPTSGGQGALPLITGRVIPKYSTSTATTYQLPEGMMVTRVYASPAASDGMEGGVSPLVAGYSPACTLSSTAPTTSSCNQTTMLAGYNSSTKTTDRGLIGFKMPVLPEDAQIDTAQLAVYVGSTTTTTATAMGAYRVSTEWSPGATWDTSNGTTAWHTPGSDFSAGSDAVVNPSVGASKGWAYWYPEQTVQEWYNGPKAGGEGASNFGLLLKDVSEGSVNNDLTFEMPESGEDRPAITFYWAPRGIGDQPQFTTLPLASSGQMTVSANVASGDLAVHNQDLSVAGTGPRFEVDRSWNSLGSETMYAEGFGYGWNGTTRALTVAAEHNGAAFFKTEEGVFFTFVKKGKTSRRPAGSAQRCAVKKAKSRAHRFRWVLASA